MKSKPSNPSVGRIVHYVLPEGSPFKGQHRAAIVTHVWQPLEHESAPGMSNLTVFKSQVDDLAGPESGLGAMSDPHGASVMIGSVLHSAEPRPGTWHWPEPVK